MSSGNVRRMGERRRARQSNSEGRRQPVQRRLLRKLQRQSSPEHEPFPRPDRQRPARRATRICGLGRKSDAGRPLKQNKLWFFFSHRYGASTGSWRIPSGTRTSRPRVRTDLNRQGHFQSLYPANNLRLTWRRRQAQADAVTTTAEPLHLLRDIGRGITPEASNNRVTPIRYLAQVKWTAPITNKLMLQRQHALNYYLDAQKQQGVTDFPSTIDSATGRRFNSANQYMDGLTQLPNPSHRCPTDTARHALKVGRTLTIGKEDSWLTTNQDMTYTVNNGEPTSITVRTTPIHTQAWIKPDLGLYVQDQWTTRRLTLNLGMRFDYFKGMVPRQELEAGTYIPRRTFEPVHDVPNWKDLSPRLGASYDLFGTGGPRQSVVAVPGGANDRGRQLRNRSTQRGKTPTRGSTRTACYPRERVGPSPTRLLDSRSHDANDDAVREGCSNGIQLGKRWAGAE